MLNVVETELISKNIIERYDKNDQNEAMSIVFKLDHPFLGIFTHCVFYHYEEKQIIFFQFKLAFDNSSRFIYYDEAGIMIDTVVNYFGREGIKDFDLTRQRMIEGDIDVSFFWQTGKEYVWLKNDPERHRPEIIVALKRAGQDGKE